ncbi:MAG TPA: DUF2285 domain-containing protein [Sphingomicrobium sp.]|nr:DUF2285 domain-containing protein [Sphingomicrobium sp.]
MRLILDVEEGPSIYPDWRDAAAYESLFGADRSLIAWEWLRRDPIYRAAAIEEGRTNPVVRTFAVHAEQFGLVAFEPPELAVPMARPLWHSSVHPFVLAAARGERGSDADIFDLQDFKHLARLLVLGSSEHLLFSDGSRAVRLDGPAGTFSRGPAKLVYSIHGVRSADTSIVALRRFLALARTTSFARSLHRRETRARRWVLMLRAADALAVNANQREIAQVLFNRSAGQRQWRSHDPSLRSQAQRLVRAARRFAAGEYRILLR